MPKRAIEGALRKLQVEMRSSREESVVGQITRIVPVDLTPDKQQSLEYDRRTATLIDDTETAVRPESVS